MISVKREKLPNTPFTYKEAIALGANKYILKKLINEEIIEKLGRNIYQRIRLEDNGEEAQYHMATLRCGLPSSICLLTALECYHVTDQISKQVWILVPEYKRVSSKDLRLVRSRNPQWKIGIQKMKGYSITTLERTLIDCLLYKKIIGTSVAIESIKNAIAQKKVKLGDIYDMAKKMKVEHRIYSYIEALAS